MKTYQVNVSATVAQNVEVEATSPEEARDKALDRVSFSLCHQCSRSNGDIGDPTHVIVFSEDGMTELLDEEL